MKSRLKKRQTKKQTVEYREQTGSCQRGGKWGDGWASMKEIKNTLTVGGAE